MIVCTRGYFRGDFKNVPILTTIENLLDVYPLQLLPEDLDDGVNEIYKHSGLLKDVINVVVDYIIVR